MGDEYKREIVVMGSVPSLGPVDLFDDMEGVFKWTGEGDGEDFVCEKLATDAFNGDACLHLMTRITGAAGGDGVTATRSFYQRPGKRYRMEMIWKHDSLARVAWVRFQIDIYDGTFEHKASLICDVENERWEYINSVGGTSNLPDCPVVPEAGVWHRMAWTIDENKVKYGELIADGKVVDMSTFSYYKLDHPGAVKAEVMVGVSSVGTTPPNLFVDDLLILER